MKDTALDRRAVSHDRETTSTPPQQQVATNPADQPIDAYALARIDYRVQELADRFNLPGDQQEDLRHDMVVELLSAFQRFNPDKAKRETFINRVLDRFAKYMTRIRCTHRRRACDSPIHFDDVAPGFGSVSNQPATGQLDEQARRELRADVSLVISRMPERFQRTCRALMTFGATDAAEQLGICRQSIYRNIAEIREHFVRAGVGFPENSATNPGQLQM